MLIFYIFIIFLLYASVACVPSSGRTIMRNFTFMWPCIVTNFLTIKPTRCTNFLRFILETKLYMFRAVPLSIIRSYSLYTQQWYMSYRFVDSFRAAAGSGWNCRGTVRNTWSFNSKINLRKFVHLVGFIVRKILCHFLKAIYCHTSLKCGFYSSYCVNISTYITKGITLLMLQL
jgi:hypothetical protein